MNNYSELKSKLFEKLDTFSDILEPHNLNYELKNANDTLNVLLSKYDNSDEKWMILVGFIKKFINYELIPKDNDNNKPLYEKCSNIIESIKALLADYNEDFIKQSYELINSDNNLQEASLKPTLALNGKLSKKESLTNKMQRALYDQKFKFKQKKPYKKFNVRDIKKYSKIPFDDLIPKISFSVIKKEESYLIDTNSDTNIDTDTMQIDLDEQNHKINKKPYEKLDVRSMKKYSKISFNDLISKILVLAKLKKH